MIAAPPRASTGTYATVRTALGSSAASVDAMSRHAGQSPPTLSMRTPTQLAPPPTRFTSSVLSWLAGARRHLARTSSMIGCQSASSDWSLFERLDRHGQRRRERRLVRRQVFHEPELPPFAAGELAQRPRRHEHRFVDHFVVAAKLLDFAAEQEPQCRRRFRLCTTSTVGSIMLSANAVGMIRRLSAISR